MSSIKQETHTIVTEQGQASAFISTNPSVSYDLALLLLHSNSSCSRAFNHIRDNPLPHISQIIAFDFLGHGNSANASVPELAYTQGAYAEYALEVLKYFKVSRFIVLGWSLGGHVAIELLDLLRSHVDVTCHGMMLVGTPPANGAEEVDVAFDVSRTDQVDIQPNPDDPDQGLGAAEVWSERGARIFSETAHGPPIEEWMLEVGKRTDGRARKIMFDAFREGKGVDQRKVVGKTRVLTAVVNGATDAFVNLNYVDGVEFGRLWEGKRWRLEGCGHAPFWERPEEFAVILERFVKDCIEQEA